MRCISPFDNGSYHMATIRTNQTNRQLGEGFLALQRVRNILSAPNEMHFSIRQRVVSTNVHLLRIDDSIPTAQLFYDSYLFRCIGQPSVFDTECVARLHARNEMGSFFLPTNSKCVVCFNEIFGWKRFL